MDDFTNIGQLLNDMEIERDAALARADAAERRAAELEAQLAAREHAACPCCGESLHGKLLLPF